MPILGWVTIGVFVAGIIFTIVWYLIQRRVTRLDLLEQAVFGDSGVRERMQKFITSDNLESFKAEVRSQMSGISEEGERREERILQAIGNQTLVLGSDIREVRNYLNDQGKRIDQLFTGWKDSR